MLRVIALISVASFASGCADGGKRPLGETCGSSSECVSGLCLAGVCLDPDADEDFDGLTNGIEGALGTNALNADSDYDGAFDGAELTPAVTHVDSDADGRPDVLESLKRDGDSDCLVDQLDPEEGAIASDLSAMRPLACSMVGVCGSGIAGAVVTCSPAKVPMCDLSGIAGWQADETSCDGKDNDCDGRADEGSGDADGDGIADCVDDDRDNDSVVSASDNCPEVANPGQGDADGDDLGDACDPPGPVSISGFSPPSPAATTTPTIEGTAEALLALAFFADAKCEVALGEGEADAAGRFAIALTVPADGMTPIHLRATNRAGLASECRPSFAVFVNDATTPAPPVVAEPALSPTRSPIASLELAPPIEDVTLDVFQSTGGVAPVSITGGCDGAPVKSLTLAAGKGASIAFDLVPNRVNEISALTRDAAGNASACTALATVIHDDEDPSGPALAAATVAALAAPGGGDPIFEVGGCAEADATVAIYGDAACQGPALANVDTEGELAECDAGAGAWSAALDVVPDDSTSFWMQVTDGAGNVSACLSLGTYVHDGTAPTEVVMRSIRGTAWGATTATFAVEGDGEEWASIELSTSPTCSGAPLDVPSGGPFGLWLGNVTASNDTPDLYGRQRDRAGNVGPCTLLGGLFGEVTLTLATRGRARVGDRIAVSAPDGTPLATVLTGDDGVAKAGIVAGCSATAVTYYSPFGGYHGWTTVLGLVPGQAVTLEVDDGEIVEGPAPELVTLAVDVPPPPAGTTYYRALTACGPEEIYFEAPPRSFELIYDTSCSAESDLTLVVEALDELGSELAFLLAMHVPFGSADVAQSVSLDGPWRTDFARFAVTVEPTESPAPFIIHYRFGHKSEVLREFFDNHVDGFAAAEPVTVESRFANIEHGHLGWSLATEHLGEHGGGSRTYTELGAYVPGSDTLNLDKDLLPRVFGGEVELDEKDAWQVRWTHEDGLAPVTDAFLAQVYASNDSSITWALIGRPSGDLGFGLPIVTDLAGADALGPAGYVSFESVAWFDWQTVAGFDTWVKACSGVDLATCVQGLAETITRTTDLRLYGGE